jgi:mannose-1-phosphate guanylyltransferase
MGTAGPIALSAEILKDHKNPGMGRFFVFNSDVICDFPLSEMIDFHKTHGKEGSICATKVADPSKYGVIVFDEGNGKIERFVEKPTTFVGDRINAGLYLFNESIISRIPNKPTSIEREIFPNMAADGQLYSFKL